MEMKIPFFLFHFIHSITLSSFSLAALSIASLPLIKYVNISMGRGNTIVEFFSAEIVFNVCVGEKKKIQTQWLDINNL